MKRYKENKINGKGKTLTKLTVSKDSSLLPINPNSAGIDIGSRSHFVAIPPNRDGEIVREFSSTTSGLLEICQWLKESEVTTVAMESTGSYWIPVFEVLASHGFDVFLVNAKHVKNVPGKKTDIVDCQWIQKLHSFGLLAKSFRPKDHYLKLRALTRQHSSLIEHRSPHVQHMQKALHEMNIQLATHVRDITGVTGMRIINAILEGERDVKVFAALVDPRCKKGATAIAESLRGNYREEHLFVLRQARDLYNYYNKLIHECEKEIEAALNELVEHKIAPSLAVPICETESQPQVVPICETESQPQVVPKTKKKSKNHFEFPILPTLKTICGVDIIEIPGIDQATALKILAEIGGNVDAWPTSRHFASWLGLCPGNNISGGRNLSGKTRRCANKTANLLRMCANGLWNAKCYLGAFLRRMKGRLGGPKAITATAHKLAVILYTMIKEGKSYQELGEEHYEINYRERRLKALERQAKEMGLMIVPATE